MAKKKKIFDKNSKIVVPDYKTVDIDTEKDLKKLMKLQKLKKDKILVVAAHPDDEVLGCGATLLKYQKTGAVIEAFFYSRWSFF